MYKGWHLLLRWPDDVKGCCFPNMLQVAIPHPKGPSTQEAYEVRVVVLFGECINCWVTRLEVKILPGMNFQKPVLQLRLQ